MFRIYSFLKKFKMYVFGIMALIIVAYGLYQYTSELNNQLREERAKSTELATKLRLQNDAVSQLKKDADLRLEAHKKDLEAAKKQSVIIQEKAKVIYKTQPSVPNDLCKSALDLINGVKT